MNLVISLEKCSMVLWHFLNYILHGISIDCMANYSNI